MHVRIVVAAFNLEVGEIVGGLEAEAREGLGARVHLQQVQEPGQERLPEGQLEHLRRDLVPGLFLLP